MQNTNLLKSEYQNLFPHGVLSLPIDCLAGVTKDVAKTLEDVGVSSVFDLATSAIFRAAAEALHATNNGARLQPALVSNDLLDAASKTETTGEFLNQKISVFKGIGTNGANKIESNVGILHVRDLATWPPYIAAKAILNEAYGLAPQEGSDPEYPDDLVPDSRRYPTERVQYEVLVFDKILRYNRNKNGTLELETPPLTHLSSSATSGMGRAQRVKTHFSDELLYRLEEVGPLDVSVTASPEYGFQHPAVGALLTYNQSWYTEDLALGQLLHTLALAPGESTRIAMIDWSRRDRAFTSEEISQTESLSNVLERGRSINEVTSAVAWESQTGFSGSSSNASSSQSGMSAGYAGIVALPFVPGVATGGYSQGRASSNASSSSWATSSGERTLNAEMTQNIIDRTHQAANSVRNRRATIVQEVSQQESERISTRTVTNYNHMHALSIEYFEIVQLYRVAVELARVTRCLFIPMKVLTFDPNLARRFRFAIAGVGLTPKVRAIAIMEPDHVAIVAPHRVKPWSANKLNELAAATGEVVGTPESMVVMLIKDFAKSFQFGFWEEAPIDQAVVTLVTGESHIFSLTDVRETNNAWNPRFRPSRPLSYESDPNRNFSEITRIEFIKKSGKEDYEGTIDLGLVWYGDFPHLYDTMGAALTATIQVPKGVARFTAFEFTESIGDKDLIKHLNDNALYYSQAVWRSLDSATLALLLSPYTIENRPVIELIDPLPVMVAGNYLVFRMNADPNDTEWKEFKQKHNLKPGVVKEDIVPLPSGGVFAEAVLGRANSAEKIDLTRFWNWQDSPIPIPPPEIAAIQSGSRAQDKDLKPGQLDAPVVNIVNPPSLPDPTGLSAVLQAIQSGNMFRDMSGLAATIGLTQAALGQTTSAAGSAATQAGQNMAVAANLFGEIVKAAIAATTGIPLGSGGGVIGGGAQTPPSAPNTVTNAGGTLEQARKLDEQETKSMSQQAGEPVTPVQSRQEEVLRINEPSVKSTQHGGEPGIKRKATTKTGVERRVRFFCLYPGTSKPVTGMYDIGIQDPESLEWVSARFDIGVSSIGIISTHLSPGPWTIDGQVAAQLSDSFTNVPVKVVLVPGLDPFDFITSVDLSDVAIPVRVTDTIQVNPADKIVDVLLEPVIDNVEVPRQIQTSATATAGINSEVKAGVEAEGNTLVAKAKVSGELAFGAQYQLSGTLGQTLNLVITYKKITAFKLKRK
ncbi:MAG: hypothetical protein HZA18_04650 [Nitrospirae bacterium]|nr:hypothetical protein [Nitrospirota bacterium]